LKLHIDFGFFCWQLISVVQHNIEHEDEPEISDLAMDDSGPSMGFLRVAEDEE
jgi:hypothetical protein